MGPLSIQRYRDSYTYEYPGSSYGYENSWTTVGTPAGAAQESDFLFAQNSSYASPGYSAASEYTQKTIATSFDGTPAGSGGASAGQTYDASTSDYYGSGRSLSWNHVSSGHEWEGPVGSIFGGVTVTRWTEAGTSGSTTDYNRSGTDVTGQEAIFAGTYIPAYYSVGYASDQVGGQSGVYVFMEEPNGQWLGTNEPVPIALP
ncbi:MAG: hypothetical protein ACYDDF_11265 [Thermoplasmatota archaeon]